MSCTATIRIVWLVRGDVDESFVIGSCVYHSDVIAITTKANVK